MGNCFKTLCAYDWIISITYWTFIFICNISFTLVNILLLASKCSCQIITSLTCLTFIFICNISCTFINSLCCALICIIWIITSITSLASIYIINIIGTAICISSYICTCSSSFYIKFLIACSTCDCGSCCGISSTMCNTRSSFTNSGIRIITSSTLNALHFISSLNISTYLTTCISRACFTNTIFTHTKTFIACFTIESSIVSVISITFSTLRISNGLSTWS